MRKQDKFDVLSVVEELLGRLCGRNDVRIKTKTYTFDWKLLNGWKVTYPVERELTEKGFTKTELLKMARELWDAWYAKAGGK